MNIKEIEYDYTPNTFTPFDCFKVYIDEDIISHNIEDKIVGCANIEYRQIKLSEIEIDLEYLESYDGYGAKIVNYLMNKAPLVTIIAETFEDTWEFWHKLGATLKGDGLGLTPFELIKGDFQQTKYYRYIENEEINKWI